MPSGATDRPDSARQSVERALRNLGRDRIDLCVQHRVGRNLPVEDTFGALSELVKAGKIRQPG